MNMNELCLPVRLPFVVVLFLVLSVVVSDGISETSSKDRDREAILAMAGEFEVLFNFEETVSLQEGYKLKEAYQEDATELVVVVEDTPDRIVLQHLLTVGKDRVVKHWKQVWTWEDTRIVEYLGREKWRVREISPEKAKGTWSQLVTQVDDSPRYESFGKWKHDAGYSRWQSKKTARPLPRREHTKRDDYQILQAVNRHAITPHGWVHEQDNLKEVIDENGKTERYVAVEKGVNYYDRTTEVDFTKAKEYWDSTRELWAGVSQFWEGIEQERDGFSIAPEIDEKPLMDKLFDLAKEIQSDKAGVPSSGTISEIISPYLQ